MNDRIVILIIDDIEVNRVILKGIFENDYDVIEGENGAQALEILDNGIKVDVILLDIIMPVMDGIDFLKNIKSDKRYCDIPIVVNTQAGEQENEYKALVLGADDFIAKPYEPKIVKRRITNNGRKYFVRNQKRPTICIFLVLKFCIKRIHNDSTNSINSLYKRTTGLQYNEFTS